VTTEAPPRADEAPSQRRVERRWTPVFAVLGVIALVTAGPGVLVGDDQGGEVVRVGAVAVTPRPGWELVDRATEGDTDQVVLQRGSALMLVVAATDAGPSVTDLARGYADVVLRDRLAQLVIVDEVTTVSTASGRTGVRFAYVGVEQGGGAVEGVVTTVIGPTGEGVVFDAFSPEGGLPAAIDDVRVMVDGAVIG